VADRLLPSTCASATVTQRHPATNLRANLPSGTSSANSRTLMGSVCEGTDAGNSGGGKEPQLKAKQEATPRSARLLSNLSMCRFVLGWKKHGHEKRLAAHIVNYADDLVICCRGRPEEALAIMRDIMTRLKHGRPRKSERDLAPELTQQAALLRGEKPLGSFIRETFIRTSRV
jgi:hypothetical protein